ncbi:MAG: hypothetical protein Q4E16_07115 [Neisseria sp.]|nr:hypothetical protein [Neisseria sp.]
MDEKDIPQDQSRSYQGQNKIIYATRDGQYLAAKSNGWDTEDYATQQAVAQLTEQAHNAWQRYQAGEVSALFYLMHAYRHDESSLAQAAGVFRWQLRRHFQPHIFAKLSAKTLAKYQQSLQLSEAELKNPTPPQPK